MLKVLQGPHTDKENTKLVPVILKDIFCCFKIFFVKKIPKDKFKKYLKEQQPDWDNILNVLFIREGEEDTVTLTY